MKTVISRFFFKVPLNSTLPTRPVFMTPLHWLSFTVKLREALPKRGDCCGHQNRYSLYCREYLLEDLLKIYQSNHIFHFKHILTEYKPHTKNFVIFGQGYILSCKSSAYLTQILMCCKCLWNQTYCIQALCIVLKWERRHQDEQNMVPN